MADGVANDFGLIARMLSDGFNRLDHRLDEVTRRLDSKADNSRVDILEQHLANYKLEVAERFRPLERRETINDATAKWKIWLGNAAVLFAASSVGAFLYYIASLGGHN